MFALAMMLTRGGRSMFVRSSQDSLTRSCFRVHFNRSIAQSTILGYKENKKKKKTNLQVWAGTETIESWRRLETALERLEWHYVQRGPKAEGGRR